MVEQVKRLTTREKQELGPLVATARHFSNEAATWWGDVGALLDKFESRGHSMCCPIGGMRMSGRNGPSGTVPCPCGWDAPENTEDVLRRMIMFVGKRLEHDPTDVEATDLLTDAMAALNRAPR